MSSLPDPFALTDRQFSELRDAPLVDQERAFSTFLRTFSGSPLAMVSEAMQNAQRAGATVVDCSFEEDIFGHDLADRERQSEHLSRDHTTGLSITRVTIRDNGKGIYGPSELLPLLCLGASGWDEGVMTNQEPLGVGLYSLLANDRVQRVQVRSNYLAFDLDTRRWCKDVSYRSSWAYRIEKLADPEPGFTLIIEAQKELADAFYLLCSQDSPRFDAWTWTKNDKVYTGEGWNPLLGYAGRITFRLNGEPRAVALPDTVCLAQAPIQLQYAGNSLRIALRKPTNWRRDDNVVINWYGQLVSVDRPWKLSESNERTPPAEIFVYLEVTEGHPLVMQAPVRSGVVTDDAWWQFLETVVDAVFAYVCAAAGESASTYGTPKPSHVSLLYALDAERAKQECAFVLVRRLTRVDMHGGHPWGISSESDMACESKVLVVRQNELDRFPLVEEYVVVHWPDGDTESLLFNLVIPESREEVFDVGLSSFISALGLELYSKDVGSTNRYELVWAPGSLGDGLHTANLGQWALRRLDTEEDMVWLPVPEEAHVVVVEETASWDFGESTVFFGTADILTTLQHMARAAHSHDDDMGEDNESCCTAFDETVDDLIRSHYLRYPAIPASVKLSDLHYALPLDVRSGRSPITTVEFLRELDPVADAMADTNVGKIEPEAVRIHLLDQSTHFYQLYGD